jgi:hypothetical protein
MLMMSRAERLVWFDVQMLPPGTASRRWCSRLRNAQQTVLGTERESDATVHMAMIWKTERERMFRASLG